jgi:MFS family permease
MSSNISSCHAEQANPKRWGILAVLVTALVVVILDNTVLNVALKTIQLDLDASQSELVWAINSYTLVFAALLFTWGVMGDRYGRKKILMIGLVLFGLASALSAWSSSPEMLIITRALMGIGGASVTPVTLAIITVVFPPHERGKAIGFWAGAVVIFRASISATEKPNLSPYIVIKRHNVSNHRAS